MCTQKKKILDKNVEKANRSHWQRIQEKVLALQQENSNMLTIQRWAMINNILKYHGRLCQMSELAKTDEWCLTNRAPSIPKNAKSTHTHTPSPHLDTNINTSAYIYVDDPQAGPPTYRGGMHQPITIQ